MFSEDSLPAGVIQNIHGAGLRGRNSLHSLHTRDERSVSVDVITATTSIIGVLIAVISLIQGYRRWRRYKKESAALSGNQQQPTSDLGPENRASTADANHIVYAVCAILAYIRIANHISRHDDERDAGITRASNIAITDQADTVELESVVVPQEEETIKHLNDDTSRH